jgi:hypothetical protein
LVQRRIADFGIRPALGMGLGSLFFVGGSILLFQRTAFAPYIYLLLMFSAIFRLSESRRNDFLATCFPHPKIRLVRLLENGFVLAPFLVFLLIHQAWLFAIAALLGSVLLSQWTFRGGNGYAIPTPFGKHPFEFAVGFRKTFWLFGLLYFVGGMGIWVDNFNLLAFSLGAIYIVSLSFHTQPEPEFYVWVFDRKPAPFLWMKIRQAFFGAWLLAMPIALAAGIFYPHQVLLLLGLMMVGGLIQATVISAKYAAFPQEMNIPEGAVLALCISMPPLLLVFAPYFFQKALRQLKTYLP